MQSLSSLPKKLSSWNVSGWHLLVVQSSAYMSLLQGATLTTRSKPDAHSFLIPPCSANQFSHSVMSDCLRPHGLQHARFPGPSPTYSLLKLMSIEPVMPSNHLILCHPLLLPPSIFPSIRVFSNESGGQRIGVSASASVLSMNIQDWFPLGWTGWISLQSKGCSRVFSNTTVQKHQFFGAQLSLQSNSQSIHDYWKNHDGHEFE